MSSVSVSYGIKSIKLPVTPGTPTSEILNRSVAHFKLDPIATGLFHNDTELSTSLPFRFLNLPAGAKLSLKPSKSVKKAEANVKFQFINFDFQPSSIVKKLSNQLSIRQAIEEIEKELKVSILNEKKPLKFQSITKVIEQDEIDKITLAQFGIESSGVVRVSIPNNEPLKPIPPIVSKPIASKATKKEEPKEAQKETIIKPEEKFEPKEDLQSESKKDVKDEPKDEDEDEIIPDAPADSPSITYQQKEIEAIELEPKEIPQHVYVYKPSSNPLPEAEVDESVYDVTVSQARQYQAMLSQKAHETAKDRKLREASKKPITNIEVRIRFPDNSNVQVNFKPHETNQDLYKFVLTTLVKEEEEFQLHLPYPPKTLTNDGTKLTDNLGSRNLLLFQTKRKTGSFLKQEFLSKAQDIEEAEEIKLDLNRNLLKEDSNVSTSEDSNIHNGVLPKRKEIGSSTSSGSTGKKLPKWLKLGKK